MSACYCDGYGLCFGGATEFDYYFELKYNRNELRGELRVWKEMAEAANSVDGHDGPENGKDQKLMGMILELEAEMDGMLQAAFKLGKDPRQRALEAGRDWHEGDSF